MHSSSLVACSVLTPVACSVLADIIAWLARGLKLDHDDTPPEAALMLTCGSEMLLLQCTGAKQSFLHTAPALRTSLVASESWVLPGSGAREGIANHEVAHNTTVRHAIEDIGTMPAGQSRGMMNVDFSNGDGGRTAARVFVHEISPATKATLQLTLSENFRRFRWFQMREIYHDVDVAKSKAVLMQRVPRVSFEYKEGKELLKQRRAGYTPLVRELIMMLHPHFAKEWAPTVDSPPSYFERVQRAQEVGSRSSSIIDMLRSSVSVSASSSAATTPSLSPYSSTFSTRPTTPASSPQSTPFSSPNILPAAAPGKHDILFAKGAFSLDNFDCGDLPPFVDDMPHCAEAHYRRVHLEGS